MALRALRPASRVPRIRVLAGGHLVIVLTILLGVAAAQAGLNVLHGLVALLLAFQAVAGFRSFLVLRGLEVSVAEAPRVDAGGEGAFEVVVRNTKKRSASVSFEVEAGFEDDAPASVGPAWVARLSPGEETRIRLPLRGLRRGVARLLEVRLVTRYPCDLFRRTMRFPLADEVLVRPSRRPLDVPSRASAGTGAERRRVVSRGEGEFRGLREWRVGDDLRSVHWRATARVGALVVREDESSARRPWVVVLDPGLASPEPAGDDAALESLASLAASLVHAAGKGGRDAHLLLAGAPAPIVVRDRRSEGEALDALARFERTDASPPPAHVAGHAFLLGGRARAPEGCATSERAPFRWDRRASQDLAAPKPDAVRVPTGVAS